jgi:hypothetical protein
MQLEADDEEQCHLSRQIGLNHKRYYQKLLTCESDILLLRPFLDVSHIVFLEKIQNIGCIALHRLSG